MASFILALDVTEKELKGNLYGPGYVPNLKLLKVI